MPARFFIELAAGGNGSWNAGVNYAALIARSRYRYQVEKLYRETALSGSQAVPAGPGTGRASQPTAGHT